MIKRSYHSKWPAVAIVTPSMTSNVRYITPMMRVHPLRLLANQKRESALDMGWIICPHTVLSITVISPIIWTYYTPHTTKLLGGGGGGGGGGGENHMNVLYPTHNEVVGGGGGGYVGFCPSVRPTSRVRSVAPTVLVGSISYLYILSRNRWCDACNVSCAISKYEFSAFLKLITLTLSCFDLGSDLNNQYELHGVVRGYLRTRAF